MNRFAAAISREPADPCDPRVPPQICGHSRRAPTRISNMTMLIQLSKIHPRSTANRDVDVTGSANTHSARIRQFGLCVLSAIVSGLIAAAIIAIQTAFYLHSLHY
jgi:hypothetical protein